MFESNIKTKKRGLLKVVGSLVGAVALFGVAGYLPATFLIAVYQYHNAQSWEAARCEVECASSYRVHRPRYGFRDKLIRWANISYEVITGPSRETDDLEKLLERRTPLTERNYSIYSVGGWEYWGSFGVDDFCEVDSAQLRNNGRRFEAECYVDPLNRDQIALYRGFNLGWILPVLLLISFGGLILGIYLVKHDIQKLVRGV